MKNDDLKDGVEDVAEVSRDWLLGVCVPFDWNAFLQKHRILYRDRGITAAARPMAMHLALFSVGQAAWALDELLSRAWRSTPMRGPLFILGHQRSGTTFLHRLLSRDKTHARAFQFQEMILPASSFQRGLGRLAAWDRLAGEHLATRFRRIQDRIFGPLDPIHRVRLDEVEEDEFVLWAIYASAMCVNDSPINTADEKLDELRRFDDWPIERRRRALGWYRACMLKKIHREPAPPGSGPAWGVSKNPAFTQKIPELLRVFPDARMIYLVRDPLKTIPSRLSLIQAIWRLRFEGFDRMTPAHLAPILADSLRTYRLAERDLPCVPEDRKIVIPYERLVARPREIVEEIYSRFGLPGPDAELAKALNLLAPRERTEGRIHEYSLGDFGLDEKRIRDELPEVFERYGFGEP